AGLVLHSFFVDSMPAHQRTRRDIRPICRYVYPLPKPSFLFRLFNVNELRYFILFNDIGQAGDVIGKLPRSKPSRTTPKLYHQYFLRRGLCFTRGFGGGFGNCLPNSTLPSTQTTIPSTPSGTHTTSGFTYILPKGPTPAAPRSTPNFCPTRHFRGQT